MTLWARVSEAHQTRQVGQRLISASTTRLRRREACVGLAASGYRRVVQERAAPRRAATGESERAAATARWSVLQRSISRMCETLAISIGEIECRRQRRCQPPPPSPPPSSRWRARQSRRGRLVSFSRGLA